MLEAVLEDRHIDRSCLDSRLVEGTRVHNQAEFVGSTRRTPIQLDTHNRATAVAKVEQQVAVSTADIENVRTLTTT